MYEFTPEINLFTLKLNKLYQQSPFRYEHKPPAVDARATVCHTYLGKVSKMNSNEALRDQTTLQAHSSIVKRNHPPSLTKLHRTLEQRTLEQRTLSLVCACDRDLGQSVSPGPRAPPTLQC